MALSGSQGALQSQRDPVRLIEGPFGPTEIPFRPTVDAIILPEGRFRSKKVLQAHSG